MNSNDAEIAAGEWLARLDRDDATAADVAAFEQWKAADPRHPAAYARLAATWQALDRIRAIRPNSDETIDNDYLNGASQRSPFGSESGSSPGPLASSAQQLSSHYALPKAAQNAVAESQNSLRYPSAESSYDSPRYSVHESSHRLRRRASARRPWFFFSAAAFLLVGLAGLWFALTSGGGTHTFRTDIGGFQRIVLSDQSAIELNTDTEVRVALMPQVRKVELLRGEASFEVAHDASRPFIVFAGDTAVRAVGTKFDVRRLENSIEVTVDEGKVAIGTPSLLEMKVDAFPISIPQISAGQTATASGSGVNLTTLPKDSVARKLAWQNQMLVFDGDSLTEVVAQFNRYNERQLVIADPKLAALQIGGYFRPTNLDAFIGVLRSNFGVRVRTEGNRLMLATATTNY